MHYSQFFLLAKVTHKNPAAAIFISAPSPIHRIKHTNTHTHFYKKSYFYQISSAMFIRNYTLSQPCFKKFNFLTGIAERLFGVFPPFFQIIIFYACKPTPTQPDSCSFYFHSAYGKLSQKKNQKPLVQKIIKSLKLFFQSCRFAPVRKAPKEILDT